MHIFVAVAISFSLILAGFIIYQRKVICQLKEKSEFWFAMHMDKRRESEEHRMD